MELKFDEKGLIPAVVQDADTKQVLMVAYMNRESYQKSVETGKATFWSRSRNELWEKGQTSGNYLTIQEIRVDCDQDCLLVLVKPAGPACHTGSTTCFYRRAEGDKLVDAEQEENGNILSHLVAVAQDRKKNPQPGSYTNYLFDKGPDKILKKVGEEACEVVIAGKNQDKAEISYETADLLYHLTVMLVDNDMTWDDIYAELDKRR